MTRWSSPRPAPKRHSAQAAVLASLSTMTGTASLLWRLSRRGSLRQARCGAKRTVLRSASTQPGRSDADGVHVVPVGQVQDELDDGVLDDLGALGLVGCLGADLLQDGAVRVDDTGHDLRPTDVDADGGHAGGAQVGAAFAGAHGAQDGAAGAAAVAEVAVGAHEVLSPCRGGPGRGGPAADGARRPRFCQVRGPGRRCARAAGPWRRAGGRGGPRLRYGRRPAPGGGRGPEGGRGPGGRGSVGGRGPWRLRLRWAAPVRGAGRRVRCPRPSGG